MHIRERIDKILKTDSDLDAFCIDHFPHIYQRFSAGMERKQKVNLLVQIVSSEEIASLLEEITHRAAPARITTTNTVVPPIKEKFPTFHVPSGPGGTAKRFRTTGSLITVLMALAFMIYFGLKQLFICESTRYSVVKQIEDYLVAQKIQGNILTKEFHAIRDQHTGELKLVIILTNPQGQPVRSFLISEFQYLNEQCLSARKWMSSCEEGEKIACSKLGILFEKNECSPETTSQFDLSLLHEESVDMSNMVANILRRRRRVKDLGLATQNSDESRDFGLATQNPGESILDQEYNKLCVESCDKKHPTSVEQETPGRAWGKCMDDCENFYSKKSRQSK